MQQKPMLWNNFIADICFLFQETAKEYESVFPEFARLVEEAKLHLSLLHWQAKLSEGIYRVAFVGLGNVGKSTLLNSLFGKKVAVSWNGPCTAFPLELKKNFDDNFDLLIQRNDKLLKEHHSYQTEEELFDKLNDLMLESDILNIQLSLKSHLLSDEIILVDTPGFGAIQLDHGAPEHDQVVLKYLNENISQVFWVVTGANGGIGKREKDFYEETLRNNCEDLIVTRTEDWSDDDKKRFIKRYHKELNNRYINFYFVSATQAYEAKKQGDKKLFSSSGVEDLEKRILALANISNRYESLLRQINLLFRNIVKYTLEDLPNNQYNPASWLPIEWEKLKKKYAYSQFTESLNLLDFKSKR